MNLTSDSSVPVYRSCGALREVARPKVLGHVLVVPEQPGLHLVVEGRKGKPNLAVGELCGGLG